MSSIKNLYLKLDKFELNIPSLELAEQSVTAIIGPSGSGKSTFFKVLIGIYSPVGWSWTFTHENLHHLPIQERRLGVVFQNYELFPHLTAEENIQIVMRARAQSGLQFDEAMSVLEKYRERLQLQKCWQTKAQQLSGGEKQRVALLRAVMSRPRLLLLDEPFSALDLELRHDARGLVKSLLDEVKIPTYLITHDVDDVVALAQHVVKMQAGQITQK